MMTCKDCEGYDVCSKITLNFDVEFAPKCIFFRKNKKKLKAMTWYEWCNSHKGNCVGCPYFNEHKGASRCMCTITESEYQKPYRKENGKYIFKVVEE